MVREGFPEKIGITVLRSGRKGNDVRIGMREIRQQCSSEGTAVLMSHGGRELALLDELGRGSWGADGRGGGQSQRGG